MKIRMFFSATLGFLAVSALGQQPVECSQAECLSNYFCVNVVKKEDAAHPLTADSKVTFRYLGDGSEGGVVNLPYKCTQIFSTKISGRKAISFQLNEINGQALWGNQTHCAYKATASGSSAIIAQFTIAASTDAVADGKLTCS